MEELIGERDQGVPSRFLTPYTLIDVREHAELAHGRIPTAQHIPLAEIPSALGLPPQHFEQRYGFPKMEDEDLLVFYCKVGARSHQAALHAAEEGFEHVSNYGGSFAEWFPDRPY